MSHPHVLVGEVQQLHEAGSPEDTAAAAPHPGCQRDIRKRCHLARMTEEAVTIFRYSLAASA
jgi:hypothetical protein